MSAEVGCPQSATLLAYSKDDLAPEETTAVEQHLSTCKTCLERYLEVAQPRAVVNIPDCHIVKEIGRGRFGVVYKAWWLNDEPQLVALKVSNQVSAPEERRFEREIAVLKKITSPGIVRCLDSGQVEGTCYFVMDLVQGLHLDDYFESSCSELTEKLTVFRRVCVAVAEAHALGIIHRDLKPKNIVVTPDGQPHILDFGICSIEAKDWSSWDPQTITHVGDVIGTLKYMSPEQAWGGVSGPVQEQSDIWSLGVMLYELVTDGGYPYSIRSTRDKPAPEALLERIRKELPQLPRLEHLPRGRELETLLERCLTWESRCRIDSARELADDLERYCEGTHIKTKPLSLLYRLNRLAVGGATRTRWLFSAAFILVAVATLWISVPLFGVGWYTTGFPFAGQAAAQAPLSLEQVRGHILVGGVFDDTVARVVQYAADSQIDGVTADVRTWRAVHAHLLQRLVAARPKAVVWDYYFRTPQAHDAELAAGIAELEQAGVPVVLASHSYRPDGTPELSANIMELLRGRVRHGTIYARDMVERPREFVLAYRRPNKTIVPSLALVTLAAVCHPHTLLEIEWSGRNRWLDLLYRVNPGVYLRGRDRIELSKVYASRHAQNGVGIGDMMGCCTFALTPPEQWERQTVPYEQLLSCPLEKLQILVKDKVLLIGDLRTRRFGFTPDRHSVRYGVSVVDDVPGSYLLADAIAGVLARRYVRLVFALPPSALMLAVFLAAVGCLLPIKLATWGQFGQARYRRAVETILVGLSLTALCVMIVTKSCVGVCTGFVGFALLLPLAGSFWVEFARNRHRFLEHNKRAIDELRFGPIETATLRSRQTKPRP